MSKIWHLFLSSILVVSFTVTAKEIVDKLSISPLAASPVHPDIKITTSDNKKYRLEGNIKYAWHEDYSNITEIKWTDYANSWTQFKDFYQTITIYGSGYVDGKEAGKKEFTNVNILVSSLDLTNNWHTPDTLKAPSSKYCLVYTNKSFSYGSYDQAGVYYDAIVSGSFLKLRFYLWTAGHQVGLGSLFAESQMQYQGGIIASSQNLSSIKESLNTALKNQIELSSNYSGSLTDERNIKDPTGKGNDLTTKINCVISKNLGGIYDEWKQYIQPFIFSNITREATIVFKFIHPTTKVQEVWVFYTPIKINLSNDYWGKTLSERLHIMPGKIVNPDDSTKGMVDDVGLQLGQPTPTDGGNIQYHTTAHIEFDGMEDSSEWMTVNGEPVEVLNNKFIYDMPDQRVAAGEKAVNEYNIVVHHDDGINKSKYQIKYTISNLVPTLQQKWYAWNPGVNPDQNKLITPSLPNGKTNPDYDKEINPKTGTKTEIIWVKKKTQYPFPLDPLDQSGEVINPDKNVQDYDLGFIAEGSVAGMGVQQIFNSEEVANVTREGVDNALKQFSNPNDKEKLMQIDSDSDNKYWSWQGMWHYITKTSDKLAYEKYVLIGANYQDKYPRFLDILNDSNIAVDFWTTIHGVHLKNYLITYHGLDSKDLEDLSYEQVVSYWKEYTSELIAQRIPPDFSPINYQDLSEISFWTIKMNLTTVDLIKEEIIKQVKAQLATTKLIYGEDYQLSPFDDQSIKQLLEYDAQGNATISLNINALATSTKAIGSNTIKVINNLHYDPDTVVDLSKIKFQSYRYNFSEFLVDQLKTWIFADITKTFASYQITLDYPSDYGVQPLDEVTLTQFLTSKETISLVVTIYAQDSSLKAINGTTLELINDPAAPIAPPEPPGPEPEPTPWPADSNSWIAKKTNLIIMSVIVALVVGTTGTIIFFRYRLKKGIGGKKNKKQLANKKLPKKQSF